MGIGKYTHPKYYAKRAVNWEYHERRAKGGLLAALVALFVVGAIAGGILWLILAFGHLIGLTPTFDQVTGTSDAWHHDYHLIGLRVAGAVVLLLVALVLLLVGFFALLGLARPSSSTDPSPLPVPSAPSAIAPIVDTADDIKRHFFAAMQHQGVDTSGVTRVEVPPLPTTRVAGETAVHVSVSHKNGHVSNLRCAWIGGEQGWRLD